MRILHRAELSKIPRVWRSLVSSLCMIHSVDSTAGSDQCLVTQFNIPINIIKCKVMSNIPYIGEEKFCQNLMLSRCCITQSMEFVCRFPKVREQLIAWEFWWLNNFKQNNAHDGCKSVCRIFPIRTGTLMQGLFTRNVFSPCPFLPSLPSATVVAERLCFHKCHSVHRGCLADIPWADTPPPQETATAADGTHSTGMHSC